jgi:hypothetical protein
MGLIAHGIYTYIYVCIYIHISEELHRTEHGKIYKGINV